MKNISLVYFCRERTKIIRCPSIVYGGKNNSPISSRDQLELVVRWQTHYRAVIRTGHNIFESINCRSPSWFIGFCVRIMNVRSLYRAIQIPSLRPMQLKLIVLPGTRLQTSLSGFSERFISVLYIFFGFQW